MSSQRGPITALKVGHGYGQANIAVSASEDQSAVVWDYRKGVALRTYLLRGIPRALALDSSDRGYYTTYDDGSVQLIDFYDELLHINALYDEDITAPVQPGERHAWSADGQELGEGLSLAISYDGTRLLSGHKSGKIASWDVSKGSFMTVTDILPGSVCNLAMAPVQDMSKTGTKAVRLVDIIKPRMMTSEADGIIPGDYSFSLQLKSKMPITRLQATEDVRSCRQSSFHQTLMHPSFPPDFLDTAIAELTFAGSSNLIAADGETESSVVFADGSKDKTELVDLRARNDHLLEHVAHLQKLQKASFAQLRDKTRAITVLVREQEQLTEVARHDHGWEIADPNVEWDLYQQRQLEDPGRRTTINGKGTLTTSLNAAGDDSEDAVMSNHAKDGLERD